jgi:pimeloyl-ACP methyl ester carboxylesterase
MTTYVLLHGAADSAWYWHLLEAELRTRGHDVVAPDLPSDDDGAGISPPEFLRRVVRERLGITPDEMDGSHCVASAPRF